MIYVSGKEDICPTIPPPHMIYFNKTVKCDEYSFKLHDLSLVIVRSAKLSVVPNRPWCQIVRSAKLSVGPNCPRCQIVWWQIVRGAKLSRCQLSYNHLGARQQSWDFCDQLFHWPSILGFGIIIHQIHFLLRAFMFGSQRNLYIRREIKTIYLSVSQVRMLLIQHILFQQHWKAELKTALTHINKLVCNTN